ncbi:hypothetical protein DXG01_016935 [Tephrocybe rancida]|nr:hypothetical protein DXG01_016935 [Tephrocybe rancida]
MWCIVVVPGAKALAPRTQLTTPQPTQYPSIPVTASPVRPSFRLLINIDGNLLTPSTFQAFETSKFINYGAGIVSSDISSTDDNPFTFTIDPPDIDPPDIDPPDFSEDDHPTGNKITVTPPEETIAPPKPRPVPVEGDTPHTRGKTIGGAIGGVIAVLVAGILACLCCSCCRRKRVAAAPEQQPTDKDVENLTEQKEQQHAEQQHATHTDKDVESLTKQKDQQQVEQQRATVTEEQQHTDKVVESLTEQKDQPHVEQQHGTVTEEQHDHQPDGADRH